MKRGKRVLQDERETWAYRVPKESKVRHFVMLQTAMVVGSCLLGVVTQSLKPVKLLSYVQQDPTVPNIVGPFALSLTCG